MRVAQSHFESPRPRVDGKFLSVGKEKFYAKGVTYGTFAPDEKGINFPPADVINRDFSLMASFGINSVRTYTVPPFHLLDSAEKHGLKVLVGLPWEQHIAFLDERKRIREIKARVAAAIDSCERHSAILAYTLGNEIPSSVVRWYGHDRIEGFLKALYEVGKRADPEGLFTYVNFPTTEYLDLSFTDFDCFNVYLESKEKLNPYLARLHNLSGDRPLMMAEIGLDSRRNGAEVQASSLEWQIRSVFSSGCAGAFVFAWTDEWWRGGFEIEDWDFGLTDRERNPKPALFAVSKRFSAVPFSVESPPVKISVVICSYNGASTIRDTLEALKRVEYSDYEVIVVNDGSTDGTPDIAREYPVRLINTENRGLSSARNTGLHAANGEIVAYIDDDAYPDPHWLQYLSYAFSSSDHAGIGGPNIPPPGDGLIAECVANAPGGPVHVLTADQVAEHIPGCNMAFRREALINVGGCDPIFRAAGDDVDLCWRIQQSGKTIGFHPSAVVWHHRRNSVKLYWRQQKGYGKAEALLATKWPEKYNSWGHLSWSGRIYGNGLTVPLTLDRGRVFYGVWGTALFQSIYQPAAGFLGSIPLMPEWFLVILGLGAISALGVFWSPLWYAVPLFLLAITVVIIQAGLSARNAVYPTKPADSIDGLRRWSITTLLHIIQPAARLYGRLAHGLIPWQIRRSNDVALEFAWPKTRYFSLWSERWREPKDWLDLIESFLLNNGSKVQRGGEFERFDLQVNGGMFGSQRALAMVEEHGAGKQLVRFRTWTYFPFSVVVLFTILSILTLLAVADRSFVASVVLGVAAISIGLGMILESGNAARNVRLAVDSLENLDTQLIEKSEERAANRTVGRRKAANP